MAQNLCRNIEVAHGQVEHDGEVVQVARSGGPIRHNFDGTVQGSPRACLAGRQVAHTGGPCGSCRRRGRTERAHRALENAARFPRASTGLSTSDHPRQTPEEPRVLLGNPDRPGTVTPHRNRKGGAGNPPPTGARARFLSRPRRARNVVRHGRDQSAVGPDQRDGRLRGFGTDEIEDDVERFFAERREIRPSVDPSDPRGEQQIEIGGARRSRDVSVRIQGDLRRETADGSRCTEDQDPVTSPKAGRLDQLVGCESANWHRRWSGRSSAARTPASS